MHQKDEPPLRGRMLVVDDQPNMCWVLAKLLTDRGHEVRTAVTGSSALAVLAGFDCQVAIVDYRLPDGDGISLIVRIAEQFPHLQSILMTSYGSKSLQQQAQDEMLYAYMDKPFNNDLMIQTVEEALLLGANGAHPIASGYSVRTRFPGRRRPY